VIIRRRQVSSSVARSGRRKSELAREFCSTPIESDPRVTIFHRCAARLMVVYSRASGDTARSRPSRTIFRLEDQGLRTLSLVGERHRFGSWITSIREDTIRPCFPPSGNALSCDHHVAVDCWDLAGRLSRRPLSSPRWALELITRMVAPKSLSKFANLAAQAQGLPVQNCSSLSNHAPFAGKPWPPRKFRSTDP